MDAILNVLKAAAIETQGVECLPGRGVTVYSLNGETTVCVDLGAKTNAMARRVKSALMSARISFTESMHGGYNTEVHYYTI